MDDHLAFRGHTRRRDWERVSHGLYWQPSWPDGLLDQLRARQLLLPPAAAFSHLTAVQTYGWQLPRTITHPVFVAQAEQHDRAQRDGLFVCRHTKPFPFVVRAGVRLCTPSETLLACARDLGLLELVVLGDQALRQQDCTVVDLWTTARQRRRGAPMLRRVIPLLDARSESPWESIMRVLHGAADIEVVPQHEVHAPDGRFLARGDLWVVGTQRLHEYDGEVHRNAKVHASDLRRERGLQTCGWDRIGLTAGDLIHDARGIIVATDRLLGREHEPIRVDAWNELIRDSILDRRWRERAYRRWHRPFHHETGDE